MTKHWAMMAVVLFLVASGCDNQPLPAPSVPTKEGPSVAEQRAATIRDTIQNLRAECDRNAGGDWDKWDQQTRGYRTDLANRIAAAKPFNPTSTYSTDARAAVLEGRDDFPLFETFPAYYLRYLTHPDSLSNFRKERPVVAGARWLRQRGIDVIFVPVPKMTEVYPERFADGCPADRVVAPHLRQMLLDLLEADVEVLDLLPLFLAERDKDSEPLYQPADPHWAPRGHALAAKAIAERLQRYDFAQAAKSAPPLWKAVRGPYPSADDAGSFLALTPEQQRRARAAQPTTHLWITDQAGAPVGSSDSPLLFTGDSYNGGLVDHVGLQTNLPLHIQCRSGQTSSEFAEFVRDPQLLAHCRVVVWLVCNTHLIDTIPWPLPPAVKECLRP